MAMSSSSDQSNTTEIQHATISHSGSGNVYYHDGFAPTPTIPVNGSNLPNRHPHFVGRQDKIQEVMNALSSRAWIIGIDGMGGIGKTTLALEIAHRLSHRTNKSDPIARTNSRIVPLNWKPLCLSYPLFRSNVETVLRFVALV
jgi:NB-ARC domain